VKISYISFIISESLLHSDIRKSNSEPANQAKREGGKDFLDTLYYDCENHHRIQYHTYNHDETKPSFSESRSVVWHLIVFPEVESDLLIFVDSGQFLLIEVLKQVRHLAAITNTANLCQSEDSQILAAIPKNQT
jgi:hypothetical protein